jgi:hypothetical protein
MRSLGGETASELQVEPPKQVRMGPSPAGRRNQVANEARTSCLVPHIPIRDPFCEGELRHSRSSAQDASRLRRAEP